MNRQAEIEPDRLKAWLALSDAALPSVTVSSLINTFSSPLSAVKAGRDSWAQAGLNSKQQVRLSESLGDHARHDRQLEVMQQFGIRVVEHRDGEYPSTLANRPGSPPILFVIGEILPTDAACVSLVGPRAATPYGLEVARRFATDLAPVVTVASGLALGIDSAAHEAALNAGGRTIGVAACGLDTDYPKGNARLRQRIAEGGGALVSTFAPLTKTKTHHFPMRNAVMASLSLAVVVVEAGESSGALGTASAAAEVGAEVFAVPGDITRLNSKGSNQLIAQGAGVATQGSDVLSAIETPLRAIFEETEKAPIAEEKDPSQQPDRPPDEAMILEAIRHHERHYDELVAEFTPEPLSVGDLAQALLNLEIEGAIRRAPNNSFLPSL